MLLALSTLGCPELSLAEAAALAGGQGYSGLELRSGPDATVSTSAPGADRRRWRRALDDAGVQALSIASYVKLCNVAIDDDAVVEAGRAEVRLAHDLGAPWVRVFPGGTRGVPATAAVEQRAARRLAAIVAASEGLGVQVALETHDSHPTAVDVLRLLAADGCEQVSVIWDALHTWLGREGPDDTARLLEGRLAYLQVKDVASSDDLAPLPLGEGVLPLYQCLALVRDRNLTDWVSWEYERAWHPEAPSLTELGEAGCRWVTSALTPPA
ncbi:MAG: sugar phosphate isomerase/epimerase [Humibacillus sp.]|nr:sugar phosphate isomerase/epimerase [Humibacillus sp.]MDN5775458.1 sugar phosphate isomerase/epimerase [Humibacillus sp.]